MSQLQTSHAIVFGISGDTVDSHRRFAAQEHLNFPLLADPDHKVLELYGVNTPLGFAKRETFIIGPDGIIAGIDRDVNSTFSKDAGGKLISDHGIRLALLLSNWNVKIGAPAANFSLPDVAGKTVNLLQKGKKGTVVVFLGAHCAAADAAADALAKLSANPAYSNTAFLGIDSNAEDTATGMKTWADAHHLAFPVTLDHGSRVAAHFDAKTNPDCWLVDAKGMAVYHGPVETTGAHPLQDALDNLLAGKPVATPTVASPTPGCPIVETATKKG